MNKIIKKILGIDKIEAATEKATKERLEAEDGAKKAKEEERLAKLSPKELATENKEPYVAVLDTKINKDNVRNGFFELDWNEYFVLQLREAGYLGSTEEEVVDQWFQDLCRNIGKEQGVDMDRRGSGYVNFNNIGDGKSEVY